MDVGSFHNFPNSIILALLGFCVGVAGSFFGVGGAFLVTPALNILGFPMVYAIGTDLAHMTGKSIVATLQHRKMGHLDMRVGALLLVGTFPGVKLGTIAVMWLEKIHATERVIQSSYILLLTVLGLYILRESLSAKGNAETDGSGALLRRRFLCWPRVSLKISKIGSISIWGIILLGFLSGFLASFLGVGGGFIRMPAMLYLIGMPTRIAIGTNLLEVIFSSAYGTFLYAREGYVDLIAALIMLLGASVGSRLGAHATRYVRADKIRSYLGITILGAAAAVAAKQMGLTALSVGILAVLCPGLAGIILYKLFIGIKNKGEQHIEEPGEPT